MFTDRLFRPTSRDADPARRVLALAELPPDSDELASLVGSDPAPAVRIAAINRCDTLKTLTQAWQSESDAEVRAALAARLRTVLAETADHEGARGWLASPHCDDAMRADVAQHATDAHRRRSAVDAIQDESVLAQLALTADIADTRMSAAERVHAPDALRRIAEAARDRDRGVARLARQRLDDIARRESETNEADAILAQLEALTTTPGPILTRVIELNRRWEALGLSNDPERVRRCDAARQLLQERFDREHAEQRARAQLEHRLDEWLARRDAPATSDELQALRTELDALRERAQQHAEPALGSRIEEAGQRMERWTRELEALASAEALVIEAEQLAASTSVDDAKLPERWQALDRAIRTPALTSRFESALVTIEQRRVAQMRAAEQEARLARQHVHHLLHTAEQAVAAGQLKEARTALDDIRTRKAEAGQLPKPTLQRLGRVTHQLTELERWKSFGQYQACVQLCERAEAAAALKADPPHIAHEVQALRKEWTTLEQQHGTIPGTLRERFDRACEKAYAPAARFFAEQAAVRKQARKRRDEFIAAAAAHAPTLLAEPRDWRTIERWLRDIDRRWREGDLGSVDPKSWKALDAELKAALAPLRDALNAARHDAKTRRAALIEEARALAAKAMDRDTPSQVKALQARWQAQAKELALPQRDEAPLWEQFRGACNAVFEARESRRKEGEHRQREARGALEQICVDLEQLARATDKPEQEVRRVARELQDQWSQRARGSDPSVRTLESRYTHARKAVDAALAGRARSRETALWQTLAAREQLCDELDRCVVSGVGRPDPDEVAARWAALPGIPAAWEKAMVARRDAAAAALADPAAASAHVARIEHAAASRREILLELELLLGLDSPAELQAERRALQLRQLRDRFQGGAVGDPKHAGDRVLAWCAQPGVTDGRGRQRFERILVAASRQRMAA